MDLLSQSEHIAKLSLPLYDINEAQHYDNGLPSLKNLNIIYAHNTKKSKEIAFDMEVEATQITEWFTTPQEDGSRVLLTTHEDIDMVKIPFNLNELLSIDGCRNDVLDDFVSNNGIPQNFWNIFHKKLSVFTHEIAEAPLVNNPKPDKITLILGLEVRTESHVTCGDEEEFIQQIEKDLYGGIDSSKVSSGELRFEKKELEEADCRICFKELSGKLDITQMPCEHTFHRRCLYTRLPKNNTCPLCLARDGN